MLLSVLTPAVDGKVAFRQPSAVPGIELEYIVVSDVTPVGKARNKCLAKASGDYVAWVDSDDEIEDWWLDAVKEAIADKPDAVVFGCEETDPVDVAFSHAMWDVVASRKSLADMSFDEIGQREDNLFLLRYLNCGTRWKAVNERHYIYRRHPESQTSRPRMAADTALFIRRAHQVDGLSESQRRRVDEESLKELCAWVATHEPEADGWRTVRDAFRESVDSCNLKAHWRFALRFGYAGICVMMWLCSMKRMFR